MGRRVRSIRSRARRLAVLSATAAAAASLLGDLQDPVAQARPRDPTEPQALFTRRPTAAAPTLPSELTLWWQTRVAGVVVRPPAVDAKGTLIVPFAGGLSEIASDGTLRVTHPFPGTTPATGPVLSFDGTRLLLTSDAELIGFWPDGRRRTRRHLALDPATLLRRPHLSSEDTLICGAAGRLLELTPDGDEVARVPLDGIPVAVLTHRRERLVVTSNGEVFAWQPPNAPRRRASFGGPVQHGVTLTPSGELLAITEATRIVSIRIDDGACKTLVNVPGPAFVAPPLLTPTGETLALTADGFLLGHDADGAETTRVPVDEGGSSPVYRRAPGSAPLPPAPLLDHRGRLVAVWPGSLPVVVDRHGHPRQAEAGGCDSPIALLSLPPRTVIVTCASGLVTRLGPRESRPASGHH